jgi:hypothetical protein
MPKKWSLKGLSIRQNTWGENLSHAAKANYCTVGQGTVHFLQDTNIDQQVHPSPQVGHSLHLTKPNSHPHVVVVLCNPLQYQGKRIQNKNMQRVDTEDGDL